ncbi:MAG TPA: rod shape-determining protein RodA [Caulobacteraceae bacterium]|nr:rod shape-determining protein RodA [Caulobacteraceae bacterium]
MTASALTRPGQRDRLVVKFGEIDWTFCALLCLIAGIGALMLYSVANGSWEPWAAKHLIRFGLCLLLTLALALVDIRVWFIVAYPLYLIGLILLVAVMVKGEVSLGAKRWLNLHVVRIQPSEIMKIGLVLALARFYHGLSAKEARFSWKLIIPAAMIGVPVLLVAKEPDLGTAILLALTGAAVVILAGLSLRVLILGAVGVAAGVPLLIKVMQPYQRDRLLTFLHPEDDPSGSGYHILQSKIALGSGGLLGRGFELGSQSQLDFLPEKHTDFIFSTLAEEFGFIGSFSVLVLYLAVILIALRTSSLAHSHFGRLAGSGVTATFALYVLINAAMVMGMAPVVGVPMPMMSFGGTVMLTVMIGFGLVQSVKVHRYTEVTSGKGALL